MKKLEKSLKNGIKSWKNYRKTKKKMSINRKSIMNWISFSQKKNYGIFERLRFEIKKKINLKNKRKIWKKKKNLIISNSWLLNKN